MDSFIFVHGKDKEIKIKLLSGEISKETLRSGFLLEDDVPVALFKDDMLLESRREADNSIFNLGHDWKGETYNLVWEERRFQPPTPIVNRLGSSVEARPELPYSEAPSPPPPMPKSIDKWMFYAVDSAGKSTVVCIHPRYFVTFRHGTHLQLQVGNTIRIFHAKSETNEQDGYEVTIVDMNEKLDFILLRSKEIIVPKSPRLAIAEESENFLLAGFGDHSTGQQQLAYLNGIIHSVRGYYFSINDRPALLMGPFVLGTGQSSRGNSGGACWSAKGLIGINFGVTNMPETTHSFAISEAATFSPKNIISPSIPYIKDLLMAQLRIEKQNSPKPPPEKKRKPYRVDVEGIGTGSLTIDFDES